MDTTKDAARTPYSTTITFSGWERPPLTSNQRMHWRQKAATTASVRHVAFLRARGIPFLECIDVTLTWVVTDKRRRDVDNVVPTLKALCDGLVDADVVADDVPELMRKHMPVIRYDKTGPARLELTITEVVE